MSSVYTVSAIRDILRALPLDSRINRLVLFGSHAKGNASIHSDLDFYLDSGNQITGFAYFDLKGRLEDAFDREIDLLADVDVIADSPVAKEIQHYGVTVYGN